MSLSPAYAEAVRLSDELLGKVPPEGADVAAGLRACQDLPTLRVLARLADAIRREIEVRTRDEHYETLADLPLGTPLHTEASRGYRLATDKETGALVKVTTPAKVLYLRAVKRKGRIHVGLWTSETMDEPARSWKWWKREWCEQLRTKPWPKVTT